MDNHGAINARGPVVVAGEGVCAGSRRAVYERQQIVFVGKVRAKVGKAAGGERPDRGHMHGQP